jgi:hypothetical protein
MKEKLKEATRELLNIKELWTIAEKVKKEELSQFFNEEEIKEGRRTVDSVIFHTIAEWTVENISYSVLLTWIVTKKAKKVEKDEIRIEPQKIQARALDKVLKEAGYILKFSCKYNETSDYYVYYKPYCKLTEDEYIIEVNFDI